MTKKKTYMNIQSYIIVLEDFTNNKVTVDYFEQTFLTLFKQKVELPKEVFNILDTLFGYVDSYTPNPTSEDDVSEVELSQAALESLAQLKELSFLSLLNKDIDSGNITTISKDLYERAMRLTKGMSNEL